MGEQRWAWEAAGRHGVRRRFLAALVCGAAFMLVVAAPAGAGGTHRSMDAPRTGGALRPVPDEGPARVGGLPSPTLPPATVPAISVPAMPMPRVVAPSLVLPGGATPAPRSEPATNAAPTLGAHASTIPRAVAPGEQPASAGSSQPPRFVLPAPSVSKSGVARVLETARSYWLLLGLAVVVLVFLAVQRRLNRRDPRLTHAAVQSHLTFEGFE